jgi:hypothetical protein
MSFKTREKKRRAKIAIRKARVEHRDDQPALPNDRLPALLLQRVWWLASRRS